MSSNKDPKLVAAIQAAVTAYMTDEVSLASPSETSGPRLWSLAGRQAIMAQKSLFTGRYKRQVM